MRNFILALPILALSACSVLEQPLLDQNTNTQHSGQYNQGCNTGACAPGQSYSVAGTSHNGGNAAQWSEQNSTPNFETRGPYANGPVQVNPRGYGHNGYGAQQAQGYGQNVYGGQRAQGYGQPPHLRGLRGQQKRGNFYGTLGGVLHDTNVTSYGIEGRLGYDSGRKFLGATYGAEVEGSIGVIDDNLDTVGDISADAEFDYTAAAFLVARYPFSERFSIHSRAGYDFRELTIEAEDLDGNSAEVSADLDGFAFGVGAEYALSPKSGLRIDYTRYNGGNSFEADSFSASFTRKF